MAAIGCFAMLNQECAAPGGPEVETRFGALGSTDLVISQVYGGGGNSGATFKNDFIEIFNRTSSAISVSGWSVQYASASGSSWQVTALSGTIQPGHYYLVQEAAGSGGTHQPAHARRDRLDLDEPVQRQGGAGSQHHRAHLRHQLRAELEHR
jgi:hypothetical protein